MKVFEAWHGKPLDEVLLECRELYEDDSYPTVRRWRDAGGRVLGHFQVYFPEELAHAAGFLPVKVRGAAMNPYCHPLGGGEGRAGAGRRTGPCSPWGKPAKGGKTRKNKKHSNKLKKITTSNIDC